VNTDLSRFDHITPCGIADRGVTSMEKLLGEPVDMDVVAYSLVYHFGSELGFRMVDSGQLVEELIAGQSSA
jgi:lipoyl(octanoyl) transferase